MKLLNPVLTGLAGIAFSGITIAAPFIYGADDGAAIQGVLDGITVRNPAFISNPTDPNDINGVIPSSINVRTDALRNDSRWEITGSGTSGFTRIIGLNTSYINAAFGIYDITNPNKKVELFGSSAFTNSIDNSSLFDTAALSIWSDGSVIFNQFFDSGIDFASNLFGFYLDTGSDVFFSEKKLNPGEMDHLATFQGNDLDYIKIGKHNRGLWTDSEYVLAWDIDGDENFTDFVVMVESVQNVPEPSLLILCAIGLLGYGFSQRKTGEILQA